MEDEPTPFETVALGVSAELVDPDLRTEIDSADRLSNEVYLHTQSTNKAPLIYKRKSNTLVVSALDRAPLL